MDEFLPPGALDDVGERELEALEDGRGALPADALRTELRGLLEDIVPDLDVSYATEILLAALDPALFHRLREDEDWPLERLQDGWRTLIKAFVTIGPDGG